MSDIETLVVRLRYCRDYGDFGSLHQECLDVLEAHLGCGNLAITEPKSSVWWEYGIQRDNATPRTSRKAAEDEIKRQRRRPDREGGRTVSTWDEKASDAAEASPNTTDASSMWVFMRGARWQREALLATEVVERAARALYAEDVNESVDTPWPDYDSPENVGRPLYVERARNTLLAALEGEQ